MQPLVITVVWNSTIPVKVSVYFLNSCGTQQRYGTQELSLSATFYIFQKSSLLLNRFQVAHAEAI